MMNSPLMTILMAALLLSALLSLGFCWAYISNLRQSRALQMDANRVNYFRQLSSALAGDAIEYSKTHPAINPILEATVPNFKAISTSTTNGTKAGGK